MVKLEHMFENKKVIENMNVELGLISQHFSSAPVQTCDMVAISNFENQVRALRDMIFAKYNESDAWAANNYLTAKSAIVHETHQARHSIVKSIARGKWIKNIDALHDALKDNLITSDHIDLFSRISDTKYKQFLDRDIDLLVENAIKLDAQRFSYVIKHWKNIVNDELDEPSDDYKQFENRRLFLHETLDGTWVINGVLDAVCGLLVNKTLEDISNKIWRHDSIEQRGFTSRQEYRADALGYLAQGYISKSNKAESLNQNGLVEFNYTSSITSDVVVDIETLNENQSTKDFLLNNISRNSPIRKTHSSALLNQLLCDGQISMPIMFDGGVIELGHKVRIASTKMKRQLAIENDSCSIDGCSIPASWCDAHHIHHWANGGETRIENLALLCRRHHSMLHNDRTFEEKASRQISELKKRSKVPRLIRTG